MVTTKILRTYDSKFDLFIKFKDEKIILELKEKKKQPKSEL